MTSSQLIDYQDQNVALEGYLSLPDASGNKYPAVIICHDWTGKNPFACARADKIAKLGYAGFALDMYGKGKQGKTKEEKAALMQPLMQDRKALLRRITAAYNTVRSLEHVDSSRIAAIGFCFGGLCVLDLARSGADLAGVISFHGLLNAPEEHPNHEAIKGKVLALHGYDDPMVTPDAVIGFADEMTAAKANWEINMYGSTLHAFTNPEANDPDFGTVYNPQADARSWDAMVLFFREIFS